MFYKGLLHNSRKELEFLLVPQYRMYLAENADQTLVPRFTLKNSDVFNDFPSNTPTKFSPELILKAIKWGMIIQIDYKGDEDDNFSGHERVIYPMAFGKSKEGKYLLRGYHLKGWSVSKGGNVEKDWRLFRCDRILNMTFTGAFFRLAPDGYNETGDKSIHQLMGKADFNQIRNLQQQLLMQNQIDTKDRVILNKIRSVEVKDLNYNLKLFNPWANNVIPKKDAKNIRVTFAKPVIGSGQWIAIIGTSIEPNNIFKVKSNNGDLGSYKSVKWVMADELQKIDVLNDQSEFKLYMFLKAL